jgi:hypothetical protein
MVDAYLLSVRRFLLISAALFGTLANCSVYSGDLTTGAGANAGSGGSSATGGNGGGAFDGGDASAGSGNGGSGRDTGGSGGGDSAAGGAGSLDGSARGGGASRSGGGGTGGTDDGGAEGSSGNGGAAGNGGIAGAGGTAGIAGSSGSGGAIGTGGAGTAGVGGAAGSGGIAGTAGTGGAAGTGTGGATGAGGTGIPDAAPDLPPPPPGAVFAVGSFNKIGNVASQSVAHTLGQVPKALILWTSGKTGEVASPGFLFALGVSDGNTSMSTSMDVRWGVSAAQSARRMAPKALTFVEYTTNTVAEADLGALSASDFALNWTVNDGSTYSVHYLAIGGPQVSAKVITWQAPSAPGTKVVNNVGFMPETVLHFNAGGALVATPPTQSFNGVFGLGAMDKAGGQWTAMVGDTNGSNPSTASRLQKTDSAIFAATDAPSSISKEATFVSMDTGGFTVNFTANSSSGNLTQIFSLALAGVKAKAGFFAKSTGAQPASQSITTAGFRPGAVFFSSYQSLAQTAAVQIAAARIGIGASDGTHEGSAAIAVSNNVSPTVADGADKISKVFMKIDNASATIDAESDLTSFDATGFTLNWTKNDAVATQICYWALAAP